MSEPFTELVDAEFPRVDLVGKGANGLRFLIAKAEQQGDLRPDVAEVALAKAVTPSRASEGPFGETDMTATPDVVKADGEIVDDVEDLDVTQPLVDPESGVTGDPAVPGSPAWEAVDAGSALKWTTILARAKNALCVLAERERIEAASEDGDGCDMDNAFDLDDACCAIDYVIGVLAPYAVGEANEVAVGTEEYEAIGKAMEALSDQDLRVLEGYGAVVKAGRVLSAANETLINTAQASLATVLASLPQAPMVDEVSKGDVPLDPHQKQTPTFTGQGEPADEPEDPHQTQQPTYTGVEDKKGDPVAPEAPDNDIEGSGADDADVSAPAGLQKAKGDPQVAVYNEDGKLIGVVDPSALIPLQAGEPVDDASDGAADAELTPAPSDTVGVPADGTAPAAPAAPATPDDSAVAKAEDAPTLDIAEVRKALAEQADVIKGLREQVEQFGEAPAASRVLTNGAMPPAHLLRGQNHQSIPQYADVEERRVRLEKAASAPERDEIAGEMNAIASEALSRLHASAPRTHRPA